MKHLISTLFILFFSCYNAQKYPKTILLENDTIICFTTAQSKQMAIWNEQRKQCQELNLFDKKEIIKKDEIISELNLIINNKDSIIENYRDISIEKDKILTINQEEKKILKKEIRTQKLGKWIAIISGVLLSGLILAI